MKPVVNNGDAGDKPPTSGENNNSGGGSGQSGGSAIIKNQANAIPPVLKKEKQEEGENDNLEEVNPVKNEIINGVKVLGVSEVRFDDGMLIRGLDMKVYLIEKGMKRYIPGIKELAQYAGREIFNVDEEALNKYKDIEKKYSDGQLIRGYGEANVYVIKNGLKRHIISYEELKKYYFGLEIFNVRQEEILKY